MLCLLCGNAYTTTRSTQKYCSNKCLKKDWKTNNREKLLIREKELRDLKRIERIRRVKPKQCKHCGQFFKPRRPADGQLYCSKKCQWTESGRRQRLLYPERIKVEKQRDRQKHIEQYRIRDTRYKNEIRFDGNQRKAMERDGFLCQDCSKGYPVVTLVVHHLDGNGMSKPESERNHSIENLQTLCRGCHTRKHNRWQQL